MAMGVNRDVGKGRLLIGIGFQAQIYTKCTRMCVLVWVCTGGVYFRYFFFFFSEMGARLWVWVLKLA